MSRLFRLLCIIFVVFPIRVTAWWCEGHMVVAEIARQQIEKAKTDDSVQGRLDDLIDVLSSVTGDKDQSDTFTTAACWADDLEAHKLGAMVSWHYINQVTCHATFIDSCLIRMRWSTPVTLRACSDLQVSSKPVC
ncbi:hypothetical protein CYMTET_31710 [Cymbomonas tetramitiformis]|uniref:Aspergillus nuclease S1 n=1 Tax=Cymbomonas tetramitiformis TaxID=36881 RepID=A0AAE0FGH1_9CHLO|nr:hypothetical protein CYMTET_31710 [Cymbomonas tetramitiformis]